MAADLHRNQNQQQAGSGWFLKNLLLAIAVVAGIILLVNFGLKIVTRHNRYVTVPDLKNLTLEEALDSASKSGVKVEVVDSVFITGAKRGTVFSQLPVSGSEVKKGRTISLTMNAKMAKKVNMPALTGFSLRQARSELNAKGLRLGRIIYQADLATNLVLRQKYRGKDIFPGDRITLGSSIDLVVGLNYEEGETYLPKVVGMTYDKAVNALHDSNLNVGELKFERSVKTYADSVSAVVVKQYPQSGRYVRMGTSVDLQLKRSETAL